MHENNVQIGSITVEQGVTRVQELINMGFTISDFEQIIEEPTLAQCNLNKDNITIATLGFFNLNKKIAITQLADIPIDLVILHNKQKNIKNAQLKSKQVLKNRWLLTIFIHLLTAAIFLGINTLPELYDWVQHAKVRNIAGGLMLIILICPAILITIIWSGGNPKEMTIGRKIVMSIGFIINVVISLVYFILINNLFNPILF